MLREICEATSNAQYSHFIRPHDSEVVKVFSYEKLNADGEMRTGFRKIAKRSGSLINVRIDEKRNETLEYE